MLMDEVANRKLTNVQFLDPVPKHEVFKYIYASDFGISALKNVSTFKSIYSNKTFDYMACKRPILMLIDGVSRKLVEDAGCGIYIEPENPPEFRQKLLQLLEQHEATLEAAGNAGYEYAKQNFDRERLAKEYISHLEKIVVKRGEG
jgi:glycosyltransferase involved in cell wall biosynthesis